MIMGLMTALLIGIFCGIVGWAYSARRQQEFDRMARMPLVDDCAERQP